MMSNIKTPSSTGVRHTRQIALGVLTLDAPWSWDGPFLAMSTVARTELHYIFKALVAHPHKKGIQTWHLRTRKSTLLSE